MGHQSEDEEIKNLEKMGVLEWSESEGEEGKK
jgi:hypothetical protein